MYIARYLPFLVLFATPAIRECESARVLGLFPTFGPSHLVIEMAVIRTLIDRGHNVTVVTTLPIKDKDPNPKYQHIKLADIKVPGDFFIKSIDSYKSWWTVVRDGQVLVDFGLDASIQALEDPKMQQLMQEGSFDLLVMGYFFNQFHLGIAAHFKCPVVVIETHPPMQEINGWVGNPLEPFTVPGVFSAKRQPLSFAERVENVLLSALEAIVISLTKSRIKSIYNDYFPSNQYPPYDEMEKNVSLVLHTSHFSEGPIRPLVPAFIQIGGIQLKQHPDPLPKDIKAFLDDASTHGAIIMSLGSNAKSAELDPEKMKIIFDKLATLKQKVIWKWENKNYPGNSSNILFKKWLPQSDILAHPNIRMFISHCGLGGAVEAQYHGVPILGMPLFADQFYVAQFIESAGFGVRVSYHELTEAAFHDALDEMLSSGKYFDKMKAFSKIYRDRPLNAQDTAAYWMEYVIRHRGAKHMQNPAVHMSTITYYGLDVIGFLCLSIYILYKILVLIIRIFKNIIRFIFTKNNNKSKHE